jgi:hypothetical protein
VSGSLSAALTVSEAASVSLAGARKERRSQARLEHAERDGIPGCLTYYLAATGTSSLAVTKYSASAPRNSKTVNPPALMSGVHGHLR